MRGIVAIVERDASLGGDWLLWRDFAVRSAGFPASGLAAFGPGDEPGRLRQVALTPRFQEAVTWRHAEAEPDAGNIELSEMLPAPEQCWLEDADGERYVAELRLVAVDRSRSAERSSARAGPSDSRQARARGPTSGGAGRNAR